VKEGKEGGRLGLVRETRMKREKKIMFDIAQSWSNPVLEFKFFV